MYFRHVSFIAVAILLILQSCKKETQPAEENENELITTIQIELTKRNTNQTETFIWEDADGPGGELPIIDTIRLDDNSEYDATVTFWNKTVTPAENITEEVRAESENHRIYFQPSASSGVTIDGFDNDTNGMPLGTSSVWTTGTISNGTLLVVLRHYPEGGKAADDPLDSPKSSTDAGAAFIVGSAN